MKIWEAGGRGYSKKGRPSQDFLIHGLTINNLFMFPRKKVFLVVLLIDKGMSVRPSFSLYKC